MEYSQTKMINSLKANNFNFKKKFGQNFIIDENLINNIILKSEIDSDTLVIEIGPGAGSLTSKLSLVAKNVLCYEIDETVKPILEKNIGSNVKVIYEDFLKANILSDIEEFRFKKLYIVANLPYYITTPIIMKIIESKIPVDKIVVMVQKEVGDRFKATVNSKEYNSLSIFLQYYFDIRKLIDVSRNVFIPKPNVDSIVVEFRKKENNYKVENEEVFFKLVKDSFTQKRKTLKNNLRGYNLAKIESVLKKYNLDLTVRAEALTIEQFVEISNAI